MKEKTIVQEHCANFETLQRAFAEGNVCIMDCVEKATNEHVAVICAMNDEGKEIGFVPLAKFFNGNPYDLLIPPDPSLKTPPDR